MSDHSEKQLPAPGAMITATHLDGRIVAMVIPADTTPEQLEAEGLPKNLWTDGTIIGQIPIPKRPN